MCSIVVDEWCVVLQNASAQAALQAAQALSGQTDTQGGPNTVLRVIIEHMMYPITLDVLYQVSTVVHPSVTVPYLPTRFRLSREEYKPTHPSSTFISVSTPTIARPTIKRLYLIRTERQLNILLPRGS